MIRGLTGFRLASLLLFSGFCSQTPSPAYAADPAADDGPLSIPYSSGTLRFSLEANLTGLAAQDAYWGAAQLIAPGYPVDYLWGEGFARAGVRIDHTANDALSLYAGATAVLSFTLGEDLVGTSDVAALSLDDAYAGFRLALADGGFVDLSAGSQAYRVGTGMLIGDGAPEGSARGALNVAPFSAWDMAAVLRVGAGNWQAHAFYLDADEI